MPHPKRKQKVSIVEVPEVIKRPRGRPRKNPIQDQPCDIKRPRGRPRKNPIESKTLPNTNMEEFEDEDKKLGKMDLPEIYDDTDSVVDTYRSTRWTSDDWGGSLDNFSIGSDSFY